MTGRCRQRLCGAVLAAVLLVGCAAAAPAQEGAAAPALPWSRLTFAAHKFLLTAETTLTLEMLASGDLLPGLRTPPEGRPVPLPSPWVAVLTTRTTLPFGRSEKVVAWLDPLSGAAVQVEKHTFGRGAYHKLVRYTRDGTYTWRSEPRDRREAALGPESWTKRKSYPERPSVHPPPGGVLTDSYALLYLLATDHLAAPAGHLAAYVVSDGDLVALDFDSGALVTRFASYEQVDASGSRQRSGQLPARAVTVRGRAVGGADVEGVDLGFLGMQGRLTIYLDVANGLPVELSGRAKDIGRLTVRLEDAVMDGGAAAAPAGPAPSQDPARR